MKIEIRDAIPSDAANLWETEHAEAKTPGQLASLPEELHLASFENTISSLSQSENGKYIVASIDGSPVGHARLDPMPLRTIRHVARLTVVVHPGWEEKGIGSSMRAGRSPACLDKTPWFEAHQISI